MLYPGSVQKQQYREVSARIHQEEITYWYVYLCKAVYPGKVLSDLRGTEKLGSLRGAESQGKHVYMQVEILILSEVNITIF